jgi:hypothetical protein
LWAVGLPMASAAASRPERARMGGKTPLDLGESLLPARRRETAVALHERRAHTVRILMQLLERHPLGAEIAGAEDVLPVAADGGHAALAQLDRQAAAGFAQGQMR